MTRKRRPYPEDRGMPGSERVVPMSVRLTVEDSILLERIVQHCDYGRSEALRRGLYCLADDIWSREAFLDVLRDVRRLADRRG